MMKDNSCFVCRNTMRRMVTQENNVKKVIFPYDPLIGFVPSSFRWLDDPNAPLPPAPVTLQGDDIPEAFRGKSAKEVIDSLLSTSTELEKFKSQLGERDKEIASVRSEVTRLSQPPVSQLSEEEIEAQKEKEFYQKPLKVLDRHFAEKVKPLLDQVEAEKKGLYEKLATTEEQSAKTRLKDFGKYEKRIKEYVTAVPVEFRSNPQTWETAWKLARAEDLDAREKEFAAKSGLHVEGGGSPPPEPIKKASLSPEAKRVASQWGMTDEDYIKWEDNVYGE